MKKLLVILTVVVVVLVGGLVYVASQAGSIIHTAVEKFGPEITGTPVTLDKVSISMLAGNAKIKNLAVGNPDGFKSDKAIAVGEVEIQLDVNSLFDDEIRIQKILIDGAELTYELSGRGSNIDALQKNIEQRTSELLGESETDESSNEDSTTPMVIDDLYVTNTKVNVVAKLLAGKGASVVIPDIHMEDIGKNEGGTQAADVIKELVATITGSVGASVTQVLSPDQIRGVVDNAIGEKVKDVGGKLKNLFGK